MKTTLPITRLQMLVVMVLAGVGLVFGGVEPVAAVCGGTVRCNKLDDNGTKTDPSDDWCDPNSYNNTGCGAATTQYACNVSYDFQQSCADQRCYVADTCSWSGSGSVPTATPAPGQPTNTPAPAQGTDRCRVAGRVERYNDLNLRNAVNVVSFRSLDTNSYSTDNVGTYSVEKNYANVGSTFEVYVNNPYGSYRTFEVKGNVPGGCSVVDNNRTIRCPKSVCYNRSEGLLSFNFEEVAPNNCSLPQITGTSRNCSGDGRSVTVNWQNVGCSQYRVQYSTNSNFTGTVYSTDVNGHSTTIGNLTANQTWYFRVACRASSTCTPVMSGSYYTYGAVARASAL